MLRTFICILLLSVSVEAATPILLQVDATDAPRRIFHAYLQIPVQPGPLTLYYPKWIPGDHSPSGPIINLTGLQFQSGGKELAWRRDAVDMNAFHITIPANTNTVEAKLDLVIPSDSEDWTYSTESRLALGFWAVLLYPSGVSSDNITFQTSIRLPDGWKFATALPVENQSGSEIKFTPTSLTTLVDSPLIAGLNYRAVPLTPGHEIDIVSESPLGLEMPDNIIDQYKKMVVEGDSLFGARHYRKYHFLLTLSDVGVHNGQEHHESSDDRIEERSYQDNDLRARWGYLLPHEFVHSWNGKYRRPAGLATPDYQQPMKGELLWVYEGLTQYLGFVLTARSGLWSADEFRETTARIADLLEHTKGRTWRPLADTADAAQLLYYAEDEWASWRREVDFYNEGGLIWLEADAIIRQGTNGKASLDDFCKRFHGGQSGPPEVKPYTLEDLVQTLNQVYPYNWKQFFQDRVFSINSHAPIGGIEKSGWKLVYTNKENSSTHSRNIQQRRIGLDLLSSIGIAVKQDGTIADVVPDTAAARAGVVPGSKLVAVNGRQWSEHLLQAAVANSKDSKDAIVLLALNGDMYKSYSLDYHDGEKYPHLERDSSKPDILTQIISPTSR